MKNCQRLSSKKLQRRARASNDASATRSLPVSLLCFFCLVAPLAALAQDIPLEVGLGSTEKVGGLINYLAILYEFIVQAVAILAAAAIILSGIRWAAAGGNADQVSKAKEGIKNSIVGLIVALVSFTLLNTLNPNLTSLSLFVPTPNVPKEFPESSERPDTPSSNECGNTAAGTAEEMSACSALETVDLQYTNHSEPKSTMQLAPTAASDWNNMARDFYAEFGKKIPGGHMFRSFSYQQCLYDNKQGDHPAQPRCESKGHMSGAAVDIWVSQLTQEEYNWLACQDTAGCAIAENKSPSGYNIIDVNKYNWKALNYNPNKKASTITEQHHFDWQGGSSVCSVCPGLAACGCGSTE